MLATRIRLSPAEHGLRWAARYPRLWCFGCQSFRLWFYDHFGGIVCALCDRILISAEAVS